MRTHLLALLAISTAAILACGGSEPQPKPPTTEVDAGAPTPTTTAPAADAGASAFTTPDKPAPAAEPDFDALPKDKKVEIMMAKVVPNVGKLFKEHDGKKFAKFGCATCHGTAKEKSKDDPKKTLPKLTLSGGGYEALSKKKPEMVKFMSEKVVPTMAEALGMKPYNPATKKGFGCAGCHAVN